LKLLVLRNKHNVHHRAQRSRDVKEELRDDMESLQICLTELPMGVQSDLVQNAEQFQMTQPWWRGS
jgi:hypothetical protein